MIEIIILLVYFGINLFLSGYHFGQSIDSINNKKDYLISFLMIILYSVFGIIIYLIFGFFIIGTWLNDTFRLRFFIKFIFIKSWFVLTKDQLEVLNKRCSGRPKISIADKGFHYTVKLVNKRNNIV